MMTIVALSVAQKHRSGRWGGGRPFVPLNGRPAGRPGARGGRRKRKILAAARVGPDARLAVRGGRRRSSIISTWIGRVIGRGAALIGFAPLLGSPGAATISIVLLAAAAAAANQADCGQPGRLISGPASHSRCPPPKWRRRERAEAGNDYASMAAAAHPPPLAYSCGGPLLRWAPLPAGGQVRWKWKWRRRRRLGFQFACAAIGT